MDETIRGLHAQLRQIERNSVESKAFFSTISNVSFDAVLVLDEDLTVVMYNESAERIVGDQSPLGETLQDVIKSPELNNLVQQALTESDSLGRAIRDRRRPLSRADAGHWK